MLFCANTGEEFDLADEHCEELFEKAFAWYEERAEQGDVEMQYEYALLHLNNANWCAGREKGMYWLKGAAEQRYRPACHRLGLELLKAKGKDGSTHQGIRWLERAAELGDEGACRELGALYLLGHANGLYSRNDPKPPVKLLEPNSNIAVKWYERAISLG